MRNHLSSYVDSAITILLLIVAGLTPVLFLNQTTEFFEMPKLVFLAVSTLLILGLWIFSWILKGKVVITRTPLDIPLLALMVVILVSTFFSSSQFISVYGNFPRVHGSAVSWVAYILLYFVTVSNLRSISQIKTFLYVLFGSGVVVALVSIMSFLGLFLPFDFARAVNFTPTGSSFSTVALMLLLLPVPLLSLLNPNKYLPTPAAMALSIIFGITVVLLGSIPSFVGLVIIFALCVFATKPAQVKKALPMFLVPVIVSALLLALAYLPFTGNALQKMQANFPKEIQLPFAISWKVSASAFRDAPFIGTGPSTYVFNFTSYKPVEFNALKFWNFSFDTAYNEFLNVLGTLGIFGLMALVLIVLVVGITSWRNISVHTSDSHDGMNVILPALAISGFVGVILLAIHAVTLVSAVVTLFIFAALMMSQKSIREKVMELSIGIKASTAGNKQFDLLPVVFFILFVIGAGFVFFRGYNVVAADYYHRQALAQANKSGTLTYQYLQKAESMNPQVDLYRVDMAQTNFALANALVAQKGPTEANPQGSLTDQDKQTIQTLLSQSINEGRASVALSPRSSRNWEVLASIYRNITGVAQNALAFSLDAYGRAIQRDPLNPILRVNVGGIYYAAKNYDLAIRFFSDAANLKPDYANAYYNLAIALRDKGDLQNAALVAKQTVVILEKDPKSIDYQVANNLLKELNDSIAKGGAAGQQGQAATANQSNSALEQPIDNVNVSDLNNPPANSATPSAVKNNPDARLPQTTPTKAPAAQQ